MRMWRRASMSLRLGYHTTRIRWKSSGVEVGMPEDNFGSIQNSGFAIKHIALRYDTDITISRQIEWKA